MFFGVLRLMYHSPITIDAATCRLSLSALRYPSRYDRHPHDLALRKHCGPRVRHHCAVCTAGATGWVPLSRVAMDAALDLREDREHSCRPALIASSASG